MITAKSESFRKTKFWLENSFIIKNFHDNSQSDYFDTQKVLLILSIHLDQSLCIKNPSPWNSVSNVIQKLSYRGQV